MILVIVSVNIVVLVCRFWMYDFIDGGRKLMFFFVVCIEFL